MSDALKLLGIVAYMVVTGALFAGALYYTDYRQRQKAPHRILENLYKKKLARFFSRRKMNCLGGKVNYDSELYGYKPTSVKRVGQTFTELAPIYRHGKLSTYIFKLSYDDASCYVEFFPNHMRGEVLCVDDKEKCEQFLLKQGFKKIEALENPQTLSMPPMSFSYHD